MEKKGAVSSLVALDAGWNLVGPAEDCKVPDGVDAVFSWNDVYENILTSEDGLIKTQGYWMFVTASKEIDLSF